METIEHMPPESIAAEISEHFYSANQAARNDAALLAPPQLDLNDYANFLKYYLRKVSDLMPDSLLKYKLSQIDNDSKLKEHFPDSRMLSDDERSKSCCLLGILPVDNMGVELSSDDIAYGRFLREFVIVKKGLSEDVVGGYSTDKSKIHLLFPPQILSAAQFDIPPYNSVDSFVPSDEERQTIKTLYSNAFFNLRKILQKAFEDSYGLTPPIH